MMNCSLYAEYVHYLTFSSYWLQLQHQLLRLSQQPLHHN